MLSTQSPHQKMVSKLYILMTYCTQASFCIKFLPYQHTAPTAPPANISAIHVDSTSISLDWDKPLAEDWNGIIRVYHVNIIEIETGNTFYIVVYTESATINSLHPYYQYNISITAVTVLPGPASPSIVIKTSQGNFIIVVVYRKCRNFRWGLIFVGKHPNEN